MKIKVVRQAEKELAKLPKGVISDVSSCFARLQGGESLSMPTSRPLFSVVKGLHELRLKDASGIYRVFYYLKIKDAIYVVHAVQKKTQKIEKNTLETVRNRIKEISS